MTLAPGVPNLRALGAETPGDLLGIGRALSEEARSQCVSRDASGVLSRCPLPGTPAREDGRLEGRPRGAGTGWMYLRRYHACSLREALAARFTAPRSGSLAAREWNLLCRLRSVGVATPEPLAVASAGRGVFARRSALVTRELDGMGPALERLASGRDPKRRRRALRALGRALGRLLDSGVWLPRLAARHVYLGEAPAGGCDVAPPIGDGLTWSKLPAVAITSTRGGRMVGALAEARQVELLARLDASSRAREVLSPRERLRIFLLATARGLDRGARRAALARMAPR